jgi:hypothetical protein
MIFHSPANHPGALLFTTSAQGRRAPKAARSIAIALDLDTGVRPRSAVRAPRYAPERLPLPFFSTPAMIGA